MSQANGPTEPKASGRSHVEHKRSQQRREAYWDRNQTVLDAVTRCARALERGQRKHYHYIGHTLAETLVPALLTDEGKTPREYADDLSEHDYWTYIPLKRFVDDPTPFLAATNPDVPTRSVDEATARYIIEAAFGSISAIAEAEDIVRDELRSRVDATMFATKIGEHLQDPEQPIGNGEVEAISLASGALKTIHTGGTGQGKSAGLETEGEGYYLQNFCEGRDYKLIDPVGLRDGENWFSDIPQHDDTLRTRREELGLAPSFAEDPDRDPDTYPQLEIYVPLTPGLAEQELPFDVDDERFVVKPYTIAAADIRKRLLISIMATKLTPQQEAIVRTAYDEVNYRRDDWMLADLAEEVRSRDDLDDSKRRPIIATLRHLQQQGFIRTREDDHLLDWRDIFTDTETITVFSQAFIDDEIGQLIAAGDLIETIVKQREQMFGIPEVVIQMREMWKLAPHNRRQSFDARAAALQEAIGHMLTELFRENRHSGVHMSGDTQYLSDLLKAIRELFNRYVVYNTNRDTVKDIFEWTANDKWGSFYGTLSPRPGEGSIVGMVGPALDETERNVEFIGPVQYAGPSHHHFDEERDQTGWHSRADYLTPMSECEACGHDSLERAADRVTVTCPECDHEAVDLSMGRDEQLARPCDVGVEWDDAIPTMLEIDAGYEDPESGPDIEYEPVAVFAKECLAHQPGAAVKREDVRAAFNEFMLDNDRDARDFDEHRVATKFGERLSKACDYWENVSRGKMDGMNSYRNLALTPRGEKYLQVAMDGLEDAAAPIADR